MPKDNEYCSCLSIILSDSIAVNKDRKCYPQIFLEECKYAVKKKIIINTIHEESNLDESNDEQIVLIEINAYMNNNSIHQLSDYE